MEELKQKIHKVVTDCGYYLYDVAYVKEDGENILRIAIENDTHITLDDCVTVSTAIGAMLDEDDPIDGSYNLEVTSAGAERELHTAEQIARQIGKMVHIKTFEQSLIGQLIQYQDGQLTIRIKDHSETTINEMDIQLIRLAIVL